MRFLRWGVLGICALTLWGCQGGARQFSTDASEGPKPWTRLAFKDGGADFHFAIVSDRYGSMRPGVFEQAVGRLNLLQPEFVICVGDLITGDRDDRAALERDFDEFDALARRFEMPFFRVPGNHDLSNEMAVPVYGERYGRPYYHFVYKNVLFLVVCTEDPPTTRISEAQVQAMKRALAEHPDVRWTFVFMHEPVFYEDKEDKPLPAWLEIEQALKDRPYTVFGGHWHTYEKYERLGRSYILLSTTGGGSSLRGKELGEFDHVVWVTMTDKGPRIANLMLDGISDENISSSESLAFYGKLWQGAVVGADAPFAEGDLVAAAKTALRLTNSTSFPATFRGVFERNPVLTADPRFVEVDVPAGETKTVDVALSAPVAKPAAELSPLKFAWKCAFQLPEGKTYEASNSLPVQVVPKFDCPRRGKPVVVDGKLDDWPALPFDVVKAEQLRWYPEAWTGPKDCSFRFAVAYDDEYLYVAIRTTDDELVLDPAKEVWRQDALSVTINARPEPARSSSRGENTPGIALAPGAAPDKPLIEEPERLPKGIKAACIRTETGLSAEIAVPVSALNEMQGGLWTEFRMNITIIDHDRDGKGVLFQWKPEWGRAANYAGSGTFRRK
jgi:hypothetical protein